MGYYDWKSYNSISIARGDLETGRYYRIRVYVTNSNYASAELIDSSYDTILRTPYKSRISEGTELRARFVGTIDGEPADIISPSVVTDNSGYVKIGDESERFKGQIVGTLYLEYYAYIPTPPSTPSSISVPTTIRGGETITISWSSSSGATRYHLERSVNGGTWTQIYQGSNRSYSDTITKGWNTVAYRVRAYNSDGYSGYRTSPTRTVINFPEMQIKINGVLKTSDAGWVRVNGQLREIDTIWVKINGAIKEVQ